MGTLKADLTKEQKQTKGKVAGEDQTAFSLECMAKRGKQSHNERLDKLKPQGMTNYRAPQADHKALPTGA